MFKMPKKNKAQEEEEQKDDEMILNIHNCVSCGSGFTYVLRDMTICCRKCGYRNEMNKKAWKKEDGRSR